MAIVPCIAPIRGGPLPSIPLTPAKCKGDQLLHILPLQEGGIYFEILFTFDHWTGYNSSLPCVLESIHNGVGSAKCFAREIKSASFYGFPLTFMVLQ